MAIRSRAHLDGRGDSGCSHGMYRLVAHLYRSEHVIPFAFDVGAIGVHGVIQPGIAKHFLASNDIVRQRNPHSDGHNAKINDYVHGMPCRSIYSFGYPSYLNSDPDETPV